MIIGMKLEIRIKKNKKMLKSSYDKFLVSNRLIIN